MTGGVLTLGVANSAPEPRRASPAESFGSIEYLARKPMPMTTISTTSGPRIADIGARPYFGDAGETGPHRAALTASCLMVTAEENTHQYDGADGEVIVLTGNNYPDVRPQSRTVVRLGSGKFVIRITAKTTTCCRRY